MAKGFILSGIHIITRRRVWRRCRRDGSKQRYDKSPTTKIYTT